MTGGAWLTAGIVAVLFGALIVLAVRSGPGSDWRVGGVVLAIGVALLGGGLTAAINTSQDFTARCHAQGGAVSGYDAPLYCLRAGKIIAHT